MTRENDKYTLNSSQFKQALKILEKEQEAHLFTRRRKIIFTFLNISVFGSIVTCLALIGLSFFGINIDIFIYIFLVMIILLALFLLMLPIFFFSSLSLIHRLWRQNRLVRKLGLKQILSAPWKEERKKTRIINIITLIPAYLGGLIIFCASVYHVMSNSLPDIIGLSYPMRLLCLLVYIIIGLSFISIYFIRRGKRRLEVISRLQNSLVKYNRSSKKNIKSEIKISPEDYDLMAKIERAQILRDQVKSINENLDESDISNYSIQKSRSFRETLIQLNKTERLAVDDQIDGLVKSAESTSTQSKSQKDILQLRGLNKSLEIHYQIDHDNNQIRLISLQKV